MLQTPPSPLIPALNYPTKMEAPDALNDGLTSPRSAESPRSSREPSKRAQQLVWTPPMQEALLVGIVEQIRKGKRAKSGVKKEEYVAVLPAVNKQKSSMRCVAEIEVKESVHFAGFTAVV